MKKCFIILTVFIFQWLRPVLPNLPCLPLLLSRFCFILQVARFLRFGLLLVLGPYKEDYLQILKYVSFCLHIPCGKWESYDFRQPV